MKQTPQRGTTAQASAAPSSLDGAPSAPTPHLYLLGPPRLHWPTGREAELPNALPGYLMAYLAQRQDWVPREHLSTLFWPNAAAAEAQHNLRANVLRVRTWLEQQGLASALLAERTRLRWALPCDVAGAAPAAEAGAGADQNPGLFLQGWTFGNFSLFAEWAQLEQQALLQSWRSRVLQPDMHKAPESALRAAEQYLLTDPLDEEVVRHQLTALQALGRAGDAAQVFTVFDAKLRADLGFGASAELATLALAASQKYGAAPGLENSPPPAASGLLGREQDLQRLMTALADHVWVTLQGLGGCGKSTLARAATAAWADATRPPLWLPLAPLNRVHELPRYWAELAGHTLPPRGDALAGLCAALARQPRLVVLDNAEHLLTHERAELVALLQAVTQAAPQVRLLVTSREVLRAPQEQVLRLQALTLPADASAQAVLASPAVQLLAATVRQQRGHFDPRSEIAGLAALAQVTGGLPLALKIAGGWARLLPCAQIANEIERSLSALDTQADGSQGVQATLARSWERLPVARQEQLAALSAFNGSFSASAAARVALAPLAALQELADAGLLEVVAAPASVFTPGPSAPMEPDQSRRANESMKGVLPPSQDSAPEKPFALHALVQAYAAQRLGQQAKLQHAAHERHFHWVREQLRPWAQWRQADQKQALLQIGAVMYEALAAWDWALDHGRADFLAEATPVLAAYWEQKGLWEASEQRLQQTLAALDETESAERPAVAAALQALATLRYRQALYAECERTATRALQLAEALGSTRSRKTLLNQLALAHWQQGRFDTAVSLGLQALALALADGDRLGQAHFTGTLALVHKAQGDWAGAEAMQRQALAIQRELRNWRSVCNLLNNLGNLLRERGQPTAALEMLQESLVLADAQGFVSMQSMIKLNIARAHLDAGQTDSARAWVERSLTQALQNSEGNVPAAARVTLAQIALRGGQSASAAAPLATALRAATRASDFSNQLEALHAYATWCRLQGRAAQRLQVLATLLADSRLWASLRAELEHDIAQHGGPGPSVQPQDLQPQDLPLLVEQALAALDAQLQG